ncbi:GOLPH3/VPS74 family protein [Dactylosporangium sp. CA-092794]|uniref:GOLPH3/VPS74 family protein n=1 Tax=Dactylosporangium sp. CA-092794 TaxID=3239929 RepID=UPI003D8DBFF0
MANVLRAAGWVTGPLADDVFRLCHDDRDGRPLLDGTAVRIGLASALIGELGWAGRVAIDGGLLYARPGPPLRDTLAQAALADILGEPVRRDLPTWLRYFAMEAYDRVARRLVAGHHLIPQRRRRMHRFTGYLPSDRNRHVWPRARLGTSLGHRRPLSPHDVHLLGIAEAIGLLPIIVDGRGTAAHDWFAAHWESAHPDVQALIGETRAVVGNKVLGRR